jgi:AcrR family transcriptional regulator
MEIKDRIIHQASQLFTRNGIRSVSMDDIASHLAISKKTLYKWFENKDQIVTAVMDGHLCGVQGECNAIAGHAENAIAEMVQIMQWAEKQWANTHPSVFYDLQKYYPAAWSLFHAHKNKYMLAQIEQNLHRGIAEGLYRADLDVDVLARLRLGMIDSIFNLELYPPAQFDSQRVQTACGIHFLLGTATLKGHKLINHYWHITEEE